MPQTRELVFEIGTEEMPALELYKATKQMGDLVAKGLDSAGLSYEGVECTSTPRRIAVFVHGLVEATEPVSTSLRGPAAAIAFDADGKPTKAAVGFARGKGIDPSELVVREDDGKPYVWADISKPAMPAVDILPGVLADAAGKVSWHRSQRWGSHSCRFVRPVRWLVCLFGDEVVPVSFCDVVAGRVTRGHRLMDAVEVEVPCAEAYEETLKGVHVMVRAQERRAAIVAGVADICAAEGLEADTRILDEVVNLVEWPTVVEADFDEEFLDVPMGIVCDSMLSNQRYFPLFEAGSDHGVLTNHFLFVSNGDPSRSDAIAAGNERVVRARLSDAKFFCEEDLKKPLESYVDKLAQVGFQEKLGSVLDKTHRIGSIAAGLAEQCGLDAAQRADVERAALLAKADLVTSAVVEFPSQQGVMGSYYASKGGEDEAVCRAIAQHYWPRFADDAIPEEAVGRLVALADKVDTVCGIFAIGEPPTGSSDPFALRRSAIGIIKICLAMPELKLGEAVSLALDALCAQGITFDREQVRSAIEAFFVGRMTTIAQSDGASPDTVEAVRAAGIFEPVRFMGCSAALERARRDAPEVFEDLAGAYARANNLRDASLGDEVDPSLMGQSETALLSAIDAAGERVACALAERGDYASAIRELSGLRGPIDAFFDDVMVMDEDLALRSNRLRLLNRFVAVFRDVADVSKMAKKKA